MEGISRRAAIDSAGRALECIHVRTCKLGVNHLYLATDLGDQAVMERRRARIGLESMSVDYMLRMPDQDITNRCRRRFCPTVAVHTVPHSVMRGSCVPST